MATLSSLMPMIRMMSISKVPWLGSYVTISTWVRLTIILFRGKQSSKCNKGEETKKTCEQEGEVQKRCSSADAHENKRAVMEQDIRGGGQKNRAAGEQLRRKRVQRNRRTEG